MGTGLLIGQTWVEQDLVSASRYEALRGLLRQIPERERPLDQDGTIGLAMQVLRDGMGKIRGSKKDPRWQLSVAYALLAELATWHGVRYSWDAHYELSVATFGTLGLETFPREFMRSEQWIALWHTSLISGFGTVSWDLAGRNSYELNPELADALLPSRTELRGLQGSDLRLPYPTVHLVFPPGLMRVKNRHGEMGVLNGATIVEDPCCFSGGRSVFWEEDARRRPWGSVIADVRLRKAGGVRSWIIIMEGSTNSRSLFGVMLPDEASIEEILEGIGGPVRNDDEEQETPGSDVFRFIMNAMVYATNVDGAARLGIPLATEALQRQLRNAGRDRRKKIQRQIDNASFGPRVILGLLETDRTVPDVGGDAEETGPVHTLTVRTLVTGHWRRQVCGPRNTERKLIFVRPFWRGPEGAPWGQHSRRVLRAKALEDGHSHG